MIPILIEKYNKQYNPKSLKGLENRFDLNLRNNKICSLIR